MTKTFALKSAVVLLVVFFGGVVAHAESPIEAEYEKVEDDCLLTIIGAAKGEKGLPYLVANTSLPEVKGDEIMRIKHKPGGADSSLFRFYYFRNGQLEAIYEYHWQAPPNSLDFKKKRERRFEVKQGKIDEVKRSEVGQ